MDMMPSWNSTEESWEWPSLSNDLHFQNNWGYYITVLLCLPFFFTYLFTAMFFTIHHQSPKSGKIPPTAPYMIPFLGNTFSLLWNPLMFACSATRYRGKAVPTQLKTPIGRLFFVQGRENICSLWKTSQASNAIAAHNFYLKKFFGMPDKALELYAADNSGCHDVPHSWSNVEQTDRIDYITHKALNKFLIGPGLDPLFGRFTENLIRNLKMLETGSQWVDMDDLWGFFKSKVTPAAVEAMCGSSILTLTPNIADDLWAFDSAVPYLAKGLPRWWVPDAYAKRDDILNSIRKWHAYARKHFDESQIGGDGDWDPQFGSEFIRSRQRTFPMMHGMDDDAIAASDLGALWATNTNAIPSTFWSTLECFSDTSLLLRVRYEVEHSIYQTSSGKTRFDIKKLCKNDLLQSLYAETLRLRMDGFILRSPERGSMKINEWLIPKSEIALVATTPAHMDNQIWNTGPNNEHPIDKFWADRFLIFPDDPLSGPSRLSRSKRPNLATSKEKGGRPYFSLDGLEGSWIPYGGGFRACPGRHFAKREILMTLAVMVTFFDIEVDGKRARQTDPRHNGLGAQRPRAHIPFKISRRATRFVF